ncbi:MAG: PTS transporter subunit EIIC [Spirochaetaceae bacterium]|nr:PTS transporter subunit EIIC [Spirochaetaceae bacterium]
MCERQSLGDMLIGTISDVFTPILAALMGIGRIKGVPAIFTVVFPGWAASGDMSYTVLHAAGGALVYPTIMEKYPFGPCSVDKFLGRDILIMVRYSGTVLPSIFAVYGASKLYKHFRKTLPSAVKNFLGPFLTLVISIPLMFLIVGPVFGIIGLGIQVGIQSITAVKFAGPIILGLIIGAFWQMMVIFGLHWAIVPIGIAGRQWPIRFLPETMLPSLWATRRLPS